MPLYEYYCKNCRNIFEKIVRIGTPDNKIYCPICNKNNVQRKFSSFSFGGRSASGEFKSAAASGGCSSCSSKNCGSCGS